MLILDKKYNRTTLTSFWFFFVNLQHFIHRFLAFLLLSQNIYLFAGYCLTLVTDLNTKTTWKIPFNQGK